jgi:glycosyltransferase involved in cell wall biosynthesis
MNVRKRECIGLEAYRRFKENYTWEKRAERILAFVNEELKKI